MVDWTRAVNPAHTQGLYMLIFNNWLQMCRFVRHAIFANACRVRFPVIIFPSGQPLVRLLTFALEPENPSALRRSVKKGLSPAQTSSVP